MSEIDTTATAAQAIAHIEKHKGNVEAFARMPERHMALVCVHRAPGEYVTWKVNLQTCIRYGDCGCCHGHYFTSKTATLNRAAALLDFIDRQKEAWADTGVAL